MTAWKSGLWVEKIHLIDLKGGIEPVVRSCFPQTPGDEGSKTSSYSSRELATIIGRADLLIDRFETRRFGWRRIAHKQEIADLFRRSIHYDRTLAGKCRRLSEALGEPIIVLLRGEGLACFAPGEPARRIVLEPSLKWAKVAGGDARGLMRDLIISIRMAESEKGDFPDVLRRALTALPGVSAVV